MHNRNSITPFLIFWLLSMGSLPGQSASVTVSEGRPNLITNPSFEASGSNGDPAGWVRNTWGGQATFEVESGFARTGKTCVKISSTKGADASWSVLADVEPDTDYRLSAWIKLKGFDKGSGYGAQLNLHELQRVGKTNALVSDCDWTRVESTFNAGSRERLTVNLLIGGWGQSVGEVWFDDVELVDITPKLEPLGTQAAARFYRERIHPILVENCHGCHGPESELKGELFLGSRAGLARGGESGPAITEQRPRQSLLLRAVAYETFEMPPTGRLPRAILDELTLWVRHGAPFDPALETERPEVERHNDVPRVTAQTRAHWSFQPVTVPAVPVVADASWVRNPVDAFVMARLERAGMRPTATASRETLIRRLSFDLLGLPPSVEEVRAFVEDQRPDAWERLVDRTLASPHYGEKWGRHWLDVVRYAETNSFERDGAKPFVWKYRDWVIDALNADMPYDQFIVHQLAGDEIESPTPASVTATGYYRLGQWDDEPADKQQALYDELDDIVGTTSQAFLGLTMNCARCHDHKLDPIPQADYYRMLAFVRNVRRYGARSHNTVVAASVAVIADDAAREKHAAAVEEHRQALDAVTARLGAIEAMVKPHFAPVDHEEFKHERNRVAVVKKRAGSVLSDEEVKGYVALTEERNRLRRHPPASLEQALCVKEHGPDAPSTHVLVRGNPHVSGKPVEPGFPRVLGFPDPTVNKPEHGRSTGRRLALARWIASPENPLTARVMANRVFQHHFGRGIVRSPNNFGLQGRPPSHPRLLDWLAAEFVSRGYRLKELHRIILLSSTWRQGFRADADAERLDPTNDLLWRFDVRRLSAEEVRDTTLAVAGTLNRQLHGPSVFPSIPREVLAGQSRPGDGWRVSKPEQRTRRSIYVHVKRSLVLPILATYDFADTDFTCPVRFTTNQPTQALSSLNGAFTNEQAEALAADLRNRHPGDVTAQVATALSRAMQRAPRTEEIRRGERLIRDLVEDHGMTEQFALKRFCVVALNLNEFLYLQ